MDNCPFSSLHPSFQSRLSLTPCDSGMPPLNHSHVTQAVHRNQLKNWTHNSTIADQKLFLKYTTYTQGERGSFFLPLSSRAGSLSAATLSLHGERICETAEHRQEERPDLPRKSVKACVTSRCDALRLAMNILFGVRI